LSYGCSGERSYATEGVPPIWHRFCLKWQPDYPYAHLPDWSRLANHHGWISEHLARILAGTCLDRHVPDRLCPGCPAYLTCGTAND